MFPITSHLHGKASTVLVVIFILEVFFQDGYTLTGFLPYVLFFAFLDQIHIFFCNFRIFFWFRMNNIH